MTTPREVPPPPVSLREAFGYWLRLGFISFGGPLIGTTHGDLKFTAPFSGRFEWATLVIGAAAFVALVRFGASVIPLIGACGAVGLVYTLFL